MDDYLTRRMKTFHIGVVSVLLSVSVITALSQTHQAALEIQFSRLMKTLVFERNLKSRTGDRLVLGILYKPSVPESEKSRNEIVRLVKSSSRTIQGNLLTVVSVEFSQGADLGEACERMGVDVMFITPMRSIDLKSITEVSRKKKIVTLTGVPEYASSGVAVGVEMELGRPKLIINLPQAVAEGCDFDSRLLKMARVLREDSLHFQVKGLPQ